MFVVSRRREQNYFIMASSVLTTHVRCFKAERAESFHNGLVHVNNACSLFQGGESSNCCTIVSSVLTTPVRCFKAERTDASSVLTTLVRCFKAERRELFYASSVLTTRVRCFKAERRELLYASSVFQGGEMQAARPNMYPYSLQIAYS